MRLIVFVVGLLLVGFGALWASDKITLEGERTIYTVQCRDGTWQGLRCSGRLVAAERIRYRSLKAHGEVIFWTVGARDPSGKFTECEIKDGRNWSCQPNADAPRSITLQMDKGIPVPDPQGRARPFHAVAKWRWFLLGMGWPAGSDAEV